MTTRQRLHLSLAGTVQGVGFRPFVYRLAGEEQLEGWVRNTRGGIEMELEGERERFSSFLTRLDREKPTLSAIYGMEPTWLEPCGLTGISILDSGQTGEKEPVLLPDLATCPACAAEIVDPGNRRFHYPFTNCTHCGPRYTIVDSLPYDRNSTSMEMFPMCPDCLGEYHDPTDRRFHAQPVSCPACGPSLSLFDRDGTLLDTGRSQERTESMIARAADCLSTGGIVALLGLGGVQLLADARNEEAVKTLRTRKQRDAKPFAVMAGDIGAIRQMASVSPDEERVLQSPAAPIVLLKRLPGQKEEYALAPSVCMISPWIGAMLPTTPLHHLLLNEWKGIPVATSGNLSDEPLCTSTEDALERLDGIADLFLMHDRPVRRPVDDSVVRVWRGRELVLRRARGYAPLPVGHFRNDRNILALGGQMKNAVGLSIRGRQLLSQHLGDLDTEAAVRAFQREIHDLAHLLDARPVVLAVDMHPGYQSSQYGRDLARQQSVELVEVQHHVAHVLACMEENNVPFPALGIAWDGTGYGPDETIWGGEWFLMNERSWERAAHLRTFALPGGEQAIREPWRVALALTAKASPGTLKHLSAMASLAMGREERETYLHMIARKLHSPLTSSMGRLFDAVSFFLGFRGPIRCEGQAAMQLEGLAWQFPEDAWGDTPPLSWERPETAEGTVMDWEPMLAALDKGLEEGAAPRELAWRFHDGLAEMIVTHALRSGMNNVCVAGGCFQNALLLERTMHRAERAGIALHHPQRVPAHDGGLALGQMACVRHYHHQPT